MGVHGLWQLLQPAGRPVTLESLEGKVLSVDVSIWLNKAAKGMRDKFGNQVHNAHLVLMFHRICKLLFYRIKPIFIFDGGVPELKKKTIRARKERRMTAETKANQTGEKLMHNFLQSKALEAVTGKRVPRTFKRDQKNEPDIFELPPLPAEAESQRESTDEDDLSDEETWLQNMQSQQVQEMLEQSGKIDMESDEFKSLPLEIQHELLTEMKESHRRRYHDDNTVEMPEDARDFPSFQLDNLLRRGKITHKIYDVRKSMNTKSSGDIIDLFGNVQGASEIKDVDARRVMSEDKQHYILIKSKGRSSGGNILFTGNVSDNDEEGNEGKVTSFKRMERQPTKFKEVYLNEVTAMGCISESSSDDNEAEERPHSNIQNPHIAGSETVTQLPKMHNSSTAYFLMEKADEDINDELSEGSIVKSKVTENIHDIVVNVGLTCNTKEVDNRLSHESAVDKVLTHESAVGKGLAQESTIVRTRSDVLYSTSDDEGFLSVGSPASSRGPFSPLPRIHVNYTEHNESEDVDKRKTGIVTISATETSVDDVGCICSKDSQVDSQQVFAVVESSKQTLNEHDLTLADDKISIDDNKNVSSVQSLLVGTDSVIAEENGEKGIKRKIDEDDIEAEDELDADDISVKPKEDDDILEISHKADTDDNDDGIRRFNAIVEGKSKEDLIILQDQIQNDTTTLQLERQRQRRAAATLDNEVYNDVQELLAIFGIPYLVSPMEAEAQCAQLDLTNQTEGSITDDSDIFLFGGKRIYKNMFHQNKYTELYLEKDIKSMLCLNREKMISIAFLTGSDYTEGIHGVGGVTAMELLQEFPGKPVEALVRLRSWHEEALKQSKAAQGSKVKAKLRSFELPKGFPDRHVWEAYINPSVDWSDETFEWDKPDLHSIREFARDKFGWRSSQTDAVLLPVLKKMNEKKVQTTLEQFLPPVLLRNEKKTSKRMQNVLNIMKTGKPQTEPSKTGLKKRKMALAKIANKNSSKPMREKKKKSNKTGLNDRLGSESVVLNTETQEHVIPLHSEDHVIPLHSEEHVIPLQSEDHVIPLHSEDHVIPLHSDDHVIPLHSEDHVIPLHSEDHVIPLYSQDHVKLREPPSYRQTTKALSFKMKRRIAHKGKSKCAAKPIIRNTLPTQTFALKSSESDSS